MFALAVASCVVTIVVMKHGGILTGMDYMSLGVRVANAAVGYVGYMVKMFWPQGLTVMYPHPLNTLPVWQVIGSELLLTGITILSLRSAGRRPYILFGWLWYIVTLFPVCGLIQEGLGAVTDHFTYIPLIGLFIIVAWGVPDVVAGQSTGSSVLQRSILAAVSVVVLVTLAWSASITAGYWKDSVTLFTRALQVTTNSRRAHFQLGLALEVKGDLDEAMREYKTAIKLAPTLVEAHYELGNVYRVKGQYDKAIPEYAAALKISPHYYLAEDNWGVCLYDLRDYDGAIYHFRRALRCNPRDTVAGTDLAMAIGSGK